VEWLSSESTAYRMLERFAHSVTRRAPTVIVPTPGLEPLVRAHGAREVCVLPGIVRARPPDPQRRSRTRASLGISEDTCVFLYLGAIGVANGLDLLLEAVDSPPDDLPAHVVVAGDGSARRSFAEAVTARRGSDHVAPPVAQEGVADLLAAADVGLHLLRPDPVFGSLCRPALEYLGAGLPFVTTVPGRPPTWQLQRRSCGVLRGGTDGEFVWWSRATGDERRTRGRQALRYGLENFGLETNANRLERLLERTRDEQPQRQRAADPQSVDPHL
jgi:glycosyltransferase involved in cell wall biosynthesis